jgi:hypothetical protein
MGRRRRTDEEPDPPPAPGALSPEARAHAIARFTSMKHRRHVEVPIVVSGIIVRAETPEELEEAATEELIRTARRSDPT